MTHPYIVQLARELFAWAIGIVVIAIVIASIVAAGG